MSVDHNYRLCKEYEGQDVEIRDHHGKVYIGTIERVDYENVYIREVPGPSNHPGGPGLFFFPLALGALIAIPLIGIASVYRRPYY